MWVVSSYLTIRLSPEESKTLTRLRALHDLETLERITIKDLLLKLLADAYAAHLRGELAMPLYKTTPELPARVEGANDNPEQISILKNEKDNQALVAICSGTKQPLTYGQSDAIRELMKLASVRKIGAC